MCISIRLLDRRNPRLTCVAEPARSRGLGRRGQARQSHREPGDFVGAGHWRDCRRFPAQRVDISTRKLVAPHAGRPFCSDHPEVATDPRNGLYGTPLQRETPFQGHPSCSAGIVGIGDHLLTKAASRSTVALEAVGSSLPAVSGWWPLRGRTNRRRPSGALPGPDFDGRQPWVVLRPAG